MGQRMTQYNNSQIEPSDILKLKIAELDISNDDPWAGDALGRKVLGDRLTNLVRDQSAPLPLAFMVPGAQGRLSYSDAGSES